MSQAIKKKQHVDEEDNLSVFDDTCESGDLFDEEDNVSSNGSEHHIQVVKDDIKLMNVLRALIILVLLTIAAISSEIVFVVATGAQESNFQEAYNEVSDSLIQEFYEKVSNNLWDVKALSSNLIRDENDQDWPFVHFNDFEERSDATLHTTQADTIALIPLVSASDRLQWEEFITTVYISEESSLTSESIQYRDTDRDITQGIYDFRSIGAVDASLYETYFPIAQISPSLDRSSSNLVGTLFNERSSSTRGKALDDAATREGAVMTTFLYNDTLASDYATFVEPRVSLFYPVSESGRIRGILDVQIQWANLLNGAMVNPKEIVHVVVNNTCGGTFTYEVADDQVAFMGQGDHHDTSFKNDNKIKKIHETSVDDYISLFDEHGSISLTDDMCKYTFKIYPTKRFEGEYRSNRPNVYRAIVLGAFFIIIGIFVFYDVFIEGRQTRIVEAAEQSDEIVRSLFPTKVRQQLYAQAKKRQEERKARQNGGKGKDIISPKLQLKRLAGLAGDGEVVDEERDEHIADLFPDVTIMFADLAGFTAWSSEREPSQVFKLLETIYKDMDILAKKMNVFKVETVGDCYVAATGLPEKQENHAEIMVQFARRCVIRVNDLTKSLEAQLGPGTGDLAMRVGIHSGPVTAGVLRGQKARFQLFGDTMNMAARIENSGLPNKIHISADTADILTKKGKSGWIIERPDVVALKGKGGVQTFWVVMKTVTSSSASSDVSSSTGDVDEVLPLPVTNRRLKNAQLGGIIEDCGLNNILGVTRIDKTFDRLIDWNVDVLSGFISGIVAQRDANQEQSNPSLETLSDASIAVGPAINEVKFSIRIQDCDEGRLNAASKGVELSAEVMQELRLYVTAIASGYRKNAFHNFEHASHVILSACKLIKRIANPEDITGQDKAATVKDVHEYTYGIGTDPMVQFAVVFSAFVHDVGHKGVSNGQLAKEEPEVADKYTNRSIAEQQSIDIAWKLLMHPSFSNLRAAIWRTNGSGECLRFRQLLVNSVVATDIFDKELKEIRNERWDRAFHGNGASEEEKNEYRATIVLEHIIQASDVSHTMQHWYIYQKWNERLFREMYAAFVQDRGNDPSTGWYNGELWFFDNYVIPLAKKLKECGVFGVSSDEYLNYALQNRSEWEQKGQVVVATMKQRCEDEWAKKEAKHLERLEEASVASEASTTVSAGQTKGPEATESGLAYVIAPPGNLGLMLEKTDEGAKIVKMSTTSPMKDKVSEGDTIIAIDGLSLKAYSHTAITAWFRSQGEAERRMVISKGV